MLTNTSRWSHARGNTVVPSRWQATLNPVNPSIAITSTASRHARGLPESQVLNVCFERLSTMSSNRAGPIPSRAGVRSIDDGDELVAAAGVTRRADRRR